MPARHATPRETTADSAHDAPNTLRIANPTMKFLFDLFPIILFFVAYKVWGIFTATAVAIGATLVQIA